MKDKNSGNNIAYDLYHMLQTATKQDVNLNNGFRNQIMSSPDMCLTFLFLNKKDMLKVRALPGNVKKHVRRSNCMAIIELPGPSGAKQTAGIHLIWSSAKPCSEIESAAEMLDGIRIQGVSTFTAQMKTILLREAPRTISSKM